MKLLTIPSLGEFFSYERIHDRVCYLNDTNVALNSAKCIPTHQRYNETGRTGLFPEFPLPFQLSTRLQPRKSQIDSFHLSTQRLPEVPDWFFSPHNYQNTLEPLNLRVTYSTFTGYLLGFLATTRLFLSTDHSHANQVSLCSPNLCLRNWQTVSIWPSSGLLATTRWPWLVPPWSKALRLQLL